MTETPLSVSEAIEDAVDFARDAWREAWAPMAVTTLGWMLIIVGGHGRLTPEAANLCAKLGWALLLFYVPLLGALYRLGLGGQAYRGLGPGGLQLGGVEWRILAVNAVLGFAVLLIMIPLALLAGLFYVGLRRFGSVNLGPAGPWAWWFLVAVVFATALFAAVAYAGARLSLATALSVERRRTLPFSSWPLTERQGRRIVAAVLLAHLPVIAIGLALQAFGWIEPGDVPVGLHGSWPLPQAAGAGLIVGAMLSVVQAPISIGLLTTLYDMLAPVESGVLAPPRTIIEAAQPEAAAEAEPEADAEPKPEPEPELPAPEPDPDPPFSVVEFFSHTGRFSRVFAPWLSHEPTPDPYAAYLGAPQPGPGVEDADEHEAPAPEPTPAEPHAYPHSVVGYSPETGRFSRLFAPWLSDSEHPPELEPPTEPTVETSAHTEAPESHAPEPLALDGADEAEHAEP